MQDDSAETRASIEIDYPPETEHPARIFRAMAALIDAFQFIASDLTRVLGVASEPVIVLERIEAGSLTAYLLTFLRQLDDDALRNLQWQPLLGQYLVRANHALIRFLEKKQKPPAPNDVLALRRELEAMAQRELPVVRATVTIPVDAVIEYLRRLSDAVAELEKGDRAQYSALGEVLDIETEFRLTAADAAWLRQQCSPAPPPRLSRPVAVVSADDRETAVEPPTGPGIVLRATRWTAIALVVGMVLLLIAKGLSLVLLEVPNP